MTQDDCELAAKLHTAWAAENVYDWKSQWGAVAQTARALITAELAGKAVPNEEEIIDKIVFEAMPAENFEIMRQWAAGAFDVVKPVIATLQAQLETARAESGGLREALSELLECADLRGDADLPHPADDSKLWTARMQTAWDEARVALSATKEVEVLARTAGNEAHRIHELQNQHALHKAAADGAGSMMLELQQECIELRTQLANAQKAARTENEKLRELLRCWCQVPEVTEIEPADLEPDTDAIWRETRAALSTTDAREGE